MNRRLYIEEPSFLRGNIAMFNRATRTTVGVLGSAIDALSWQDALERITLWAATHQSRYVCACNAHSLVTASLDPAFREIINSADMAVPDGMPIAWSLWKMGFPRQERINGPDLMLRLCEGAAGRDLSVFLYGSSPRTLAMLQSNLGAWLPKLKIVGTHSPPYRLQSDAEDAAAIELINASGAAIVFISLGCPKQERWMAQHRGKVHAVMVGVGAAFDYHAGTLRRAPLWMQDRGLEWLYRLLKEPRRLWRRYLTTNTIFLLRIARQFLREHRKAVEMASICVPAPMPLPTAMQPEQAADSAEARKVEEPTR
jgi:N-acetylglucosaminyldiphosphoundecaprenol N-acetyl-beta-D-mannosaminyltransferase